ncbi:DUF5683 domain-containing protein [Mucilaginibacter xinganensis]|uniref:DUF5683 domain-containing protein n=1 Tax=Mucilaginibacter xinganensis TaxID=1234841 RepID=A0A223P2X7_9SPHI|nr:DUF5683 domain-containing protein [Mucilaginibacter xinganensis]ASU36442.1 hypothetical protein MuYL_4557 [Mucilaginibacter xinganensis]
MYKYLLTIWLLAGFIFTARAQNPDTTGKIVVKSKMDTLKASRQDTDVVQSKVPKIRKAKVYHPDTLHSPHKAVMRSLIIPGWGQVYNHKIWKVPIIYGVLGSFGAGIAFNAKYYKEFLQLSIYRNHLVVPAPGDPYYAEYMQYKAANVQDQAIYDAKDAYRRNRDLCILGAVVFWGINAVDAYIDAKFIHSYTLDNNFSMRVTPGLINQPVTYAQTSAFSYIPGIKITFTL